MSEFKITHETTLYELQEHCKKQADCYGCDLREDTRTACNFTTKDPINWNITKPKTYKEDFLEKYPNAEMDCGVPIACKRTVYGGEPCYVLQCSECWNEIMEEK